MRLPSTIRDDVEGHEIQLGVVCLIHSNSVRLRSIPLLTLQSLPCQGSGSSSDMKCGASLCGAKRQKWRGPKEKTQTNRLSQKKSERGREVTWSGNWLAAHDCSIIIQGNQDLSRPRASHESIPSSLSSFPSHSDADSVTTQARSKLAPSLSKGPAILYSGIRTLFLTHS